MKKKRVLTIQDYSCMGRCSLTVALPTISAMGVECVGIPTAVLSNHTHFKSWTFLDLTNQLLPIVEHWDDYDHHFDMIYTGYLTNDQIPTIIEVIAKLKEKGTSIFVDPAMADNGKLYPGFDQKHVEAMGELLKYADYVKPNLTEACLLTGLPYPEDGKGNKRIYDQVVRLLGQKGPRFVILSGAILEEGKTGVYCYDALKDETSYFQKDLHPGLYHGTGDLFSSALVGGLVRGLPLSKSAEIAHDFVSNSIKNTMALNRDGMIYGPDFEEAISSLVEAVKNSLAC